MKKFTTGIVVAAVAVCFAAVGFAAEYDKGGHGKKARPEMTEQQKQDFLNFITKKNQLTVEFLNQEVQAGRMTQEVANARIILMNDRLEKMKNGNNEPSVKQRQAHREYMEKVHALRVESINNAIASGSITQEQGNKMLERFDRPDGFKHERPRGNHSF